MIGGEDVAVAISIKGRQVKGGYGGEGVCVGVLRGL